MIDLVGISGGTITAVLILLVGVAVCGWIAFAGLAYNTAAQKGYRKLFWFLVALVFGPITAIALGVAPQNTDKETD